MHRLKILPFYNNIIFFRNLMTEWISIKKLWEVRHQSQEMQYQYIDRIEIYMMDINKLDELEENITILDEGSKLRQYIEALILLQRNDLRRSYNIYSHSNRKSKKQKQGGRPKVPQEKDQNSIMARILATIKPSNIWQKVKNLQIFMISKNVPLYEQQPQKALLENKNKKVS